MSVRTVPPAAILTAWCVLQPAGRCGWSWILRKRTMKCRQQVAVRGTTDPSSVLRTTAAVSLSRMMMVFGCILHMIALVCRQTQRTTTTAQALARSGPRLCAAVYHADRLRHHRRRRVPHHRHRPSHSRHQHPRRRGRNRPYRPRLRHGRHRRSPRARSWCDRCCQWRPLIVECGPSMV